MKMIAGACLRAVSKSLRMREAPRPANISTNADAGCEKNAAPDSAATAFASSVLPVPGRPVQQHAAGDAGAEPLEALGVAQELDDLGELGLRLLDAGDVVPAHDRLRLRLELGRRGARHHLDEAPQQVDQERQQQRRDPEQQECPEVIQGVAQGTRNRRRQHATCVGRNDAELEPGSAQLTRSRRGFGRSPRPALAAGRPSRTTTSAVKSFSPRISAEPTP